jgi:hypothetical protein
MARIFANSDKILKRDSHDQIFNREENQACCGQQRAGVLGTSPLKAETSGIGGVFNQNVTKCCDTTKNSYDGTPGSEVCPCVGTRLIYPNLSNLQSSTFTIDGVDVGLAMLPGFTTLDYLEALQEYIFTPRGVTMTWSLVGDTYVATLTACSTSGEVANPWETGLTIISSVEDEDAIHHLVTNTLSTCTSIDDSVMGWTLPIAGQNGAGDWGAGPVVRIDDADAVAILLAHPLSVGDTVTIAGMAANNGDHVLTTAYNEADAALYFGWAGIAIADGDGANTLTYWES